jgi:hypothetical protein
MVLWVVFDMTAGGDGLRRRLCPSGLFGSRLHRRPRLQLLPGEVQATMPCPDVAEPESIPLQMLGGFGLGELRSACESCCEDDGLGDNDAKVEAACPMWLTPCVCVCVCVVCACVCACVRVCSLCMCVCVCVCALCRMNRFVCPGMAGQPLPQGAVGGLQLKIARFPANRT